MSTENAETGGENFSGGGENFSIRTTNLKDENQPSITSPTIIITEPNQKESCYPESEDLNASLLPELGRKENPKYSESNGKLPSTQPMHIYADQNDNTKVMQSLSVTFSSEDIHNRDRLSSPTASRVSFGFGSLDIIMDNDKGHERSAEKAESDPYERPQKWGWAVVIASWIVMIPIAGVLASFGTIVSPLTEDFNATKLEAGWIGSLAFSFTVGTCPFSTPLFMIFGARKVAFVGVVGGTISLFVTSFAPVMYMFFFTYSFLFGVFANFVYNSAMNLTGQYFQFKHQALATCLASAGVSFGTLLVNPLSTALVNIFDWRTALRILSGIILVVGLACVFVFRPVKTREQRIQTKIQHHKEKKGHKNETIQESMKHVKLGSVDQIDVEALTESMQHMPSGSRVSLAAQEIKKTVFNKNAFDCSVCNNPAFSLWMIGTLLWSVSFLFPFIFLVDYMTTIGIPKPSTAFVMTAFGISEFAGRLLCACGAGKIRFSLAYVYAISASFVGAATIFAPFGKSLGVMYAYAICAGINSGVLNSLMYVGTMQFFGNEKGKHVWGYINVMLAAGMVGGPVAAGGIYDATSSYEAAFYMGGAVFVLAGIVMAFIPLALSWFSKSKSKVKAKREKQSKTSKNGESKKMKNGSIVKPSALRRLAHQQSAIRGKAVNNKPKWNGEVESHLRELYEIEEELLNEASFLKKNAQLDQNMEKREEN